MNSIATYTYDDLEVGMMAEENLLLRQIDIESFAKLTGDHHPLHTSLVYAQDNGFENIIAHGMLISALSSKLIGHSMPGENAIIISQDFKFRKPVYPGTKLMIKGKLKEKDDRFKEIIVKIRIEDKSDGSLFANGNYKVKLRK